MIGLDSNILIRYLTQDDRFQSARATQLIEAHFSTGNPGFVSIVAMVETAWVLAHSYRLPAREIAAAIERMLQVDSLVIDNEQEVFASMIAVKDGRATFADALIAELGLTGGCSHTLTFDRKASRLPGFERA
jgi:predicted nucleic-acid-binding protein